MSRPKLLILLTVVTALGAVAGWFRPLPSLGAGPAAGDGKWNIPEAAALERSSAALAAEMRGLRWVGDAGASLEGGSSEWTLLGVMPQESEILVQVGKDPLIRRVKIGDILPDGSRLIAVGRDTASIEREGCQIDQPLYARPSNEKVTPECADNATVQELPQP